MKSVACLAGCFSALSLLCAGDAWPMFRGPNAAGSVEGARPPVRISPDDGVKWKIEVPNSPSSPVVWGDRIFLTTYTTNALETRAYDRKTGALVWNRVAPADKLEEYHESDGSPAASSCAVDGDVVVSYFGSAGLFCYDHQGRELWRHALPVARTYGGFGSGTSPLLAGDRVILVRDVLENASLLALDRKTGRKVWETPRPESPTSYSTAIVWENEGMSEVIVAGAVTLKAYDLTTGSERWLVRGIPPAACTTPVVGEGMLFFAGWGPGKSDSPFPTWESRTAEWDKNGDGELTSAEFAWGEPMFRSTDANGDGRLVAAEWNAILEFVSKGENVLMAIKPGGRGDVTMSHVAWKATRGLPYVPSPIYYDGRVYIVKDGGLISSFNAQTGEPAYVQERIPDAAGSYYASPIAADGRIYLASLQGTVTVLKAGGESLEVLHQASFGERIAATPALAGDNLYLRTAGHLYAF